MRPFMNEEPSPPLAACPDTASCRRFVLGGIQGSQASLYEAHLAACLQCSAALAEVDAEDTFVLAMRQPSYILAEDEATLVSGGDTARPTPAVPQIASSTA